MYSAINHTRCFILLVVCHTVAICEVTDLSPLWPPANEKTTAVRQAIQARQTSRILALLSTLDADQRNLWQGIVAITQNDAKGAIRYLRKGDFPKALGVAYYLAHQYLLFRHQMAEAIRRNPEDFGPYYYLGRHFESEVGDAEQAVRWLRLALDRKPEYAPARSHLGSCLETLGELTKAEAEYRGSLSVPLSYVGLARIQLGQDEPQAALKLVEQALTLDPRDLIALKLAARIYGLLGRPQDAARSLESAAIIAPHDASIRYQLARIYQARGDKERSNAALRDFERLRAIYGSGP